MGKSKREKRTHNSQFHRKEINVYRRIDCGTAPTKKKEHKPKTGFSMQQQDSIGRWEKLNQPTTHTNGPIHARWAVCAMLMLADCLRCWLCSALVRHRLLRTHVRAVLFVRLRLLVGLQIKGKIVRERNDRVAQHTLQ